MKRNILKRGMVSVMVVLVLLLSGCAAESEDSAAVNPSAGTVFSQYLWSVNAQEQALDLIFFFTEADSGKWMSENIEEVLVQVGEETLQAQLSSLETEETLLYDSYYRGTMTLTADFSTLSGSCSDAAVSVRFADTQDAQVYELGRIGILPEESGENAVITELVAGGVVAEDDDENVMTYGLIVHLNASEDLQISSMSFGLQSAVPLSDSAVIYSADEYQSTVYTAIEETSFDELVEDAYIRTKVTDTDSQCDLSFEAGEYYIYMPVGYAAGEDQALIQAALEIEYVAAESTGTYVSSVCPFFSEFTKSQAVLEEMFG